MAYISIQTADTHIAYTGQFQGWNILNDSDKLKYLERATDRIEMLAFNSDKSRAAARTTTRHSESDVIPVNLQRATALLAGYYSENKYSKYDLIDDSIDSALSPQMADLIITVQSLLYPFLSDTAQQNNPRVPRVKKQRPAFNWD